jgi:glycosyltransferase involved in cell wall biosynthesis
VRAAILLSTDSFEDFFTREFGLTPDEYTSSYRNDWAWDWCAMLQSEGVDPAIYIASLKHEGVQETHDGVLVRFLKLGGAYGPWKHLPVLKRSPPARYVSQVANAQAMLPALRRAIREDEVGVLLIQEYWTGRFDRLAGALDTPFIAVDQGLPAGRELKAFKRRSFPRARVAITQTEAQAELVRERGGCAERIPNGVDTDFFAPDGTARAERTVAIVARLVDPQKRISDLLRSLALLPADWHLTIAGTGPDGAELEALAKRLGLFSRIEWLGFVGDKVEIRRLYSRSAVFALPSAWEGLPVALLEAMSCGAACVGSDIPAIAEVIEDGRTGYVVPVGEPDQLARAIESAGAAQNRLGAAAREAVQRRYSKGSSARRLAEVVRAAAEG